MAGDIKGIWVGRQGKIRINRNIFSKEARQDLTRRRKRNFARRVNLSHLPSERGCAHPGMRSEIASRPLRSGHAAKPSPRIAHHTLAGVTAGDAGEFALEGGGGG